MADTDIRAVHDFLRCRTPERWVEQAVCGRDALLVDHASLELKAAQQAQKLIFKYGASARSRVSSSRTFRGRLINKMSRLAREELRHFEQVVALIERRGVCYEAVSPSRYAAGLHALARKDEPGALVDALVIGAIIEARSCERFHSFLEPLCAVDAELADFYASLLRAESRHFEDYLALARTAAGRTDIDDVIAPFLARDAELIEAPDNELRFLSGALA